MIPSTVLNFLKTNYKWVLIVVLPIAAFIAGAAIHPQPAKVVTVDRVVEKEKIVYRDREVTTDKTKADTKVNKHTDRVVVTNKDGTKTEHTVTDTQAVKTVFVDRVVEKVVNRDVFVDKVVEHTVTVDNQKRFSAGLLLGVHPDILPVPKIESYAVGATFDVRIVGPVWAGVWGMGTTSGQALGGIQARIEF